MAAAGPASAQDGSLEARVGGSHALPPAGATGDASSYLGAGLLAWTTPDGTDGLLWASLDGAVEVSGDGDWASLSAGATRGWPLVGGLAVGLELEGRAFAVGGATPYRAAAAEAVPGLSWSAGPVELFVEGRAGAGRSTVETAAAAGPDGGPGTPGGGPGAPGPPGGPGDGEGEASTVETTTDLWTAGGDAGLRLALGRQELELRAGFRDAAAGEHRRAAVELRGAAAGLTWRAGAGWWDTPTGDELVGSVGLALPVGGGWRARATGGRARPDPLLGSRPGGHGGVEVRRELVRFGGGEETPVYRIRGEDGRARVEFTLAAPEAGQVALLGDFTDWEPVRMEREDGRWRVELEVRPGVHHFGFRVDGRWHVPEDAPGRVDDEWGRVNATLVVSG